MSQSPKSMTGNLASVQIKSFDRNRLPEASQMLARAFVTNPLHEAAFGRGALTKNVAFFRAGLLVMKGPMLMAVEGNRLLGFIHWVAAPSCQFSAFEKLRMLPPMVYHFGMGSALRVSRWLSAWSAHDPAKAHVHLGPIGIAPEAQGRGIGRLLMDCYCQELDRTGQEGYLETDRPRNVPFYGRFGFRTVREVCVLNVPNFLMVRQPQ